MTLKESYKKWSQLTENQCMLIRNRNVFNKVWSKLPFHLECDQYTVEILAGAFIQSKVVYGDKVRCLSMLTLIINYGMDGKCTFKYNNVLDKVTELELVTLNEKSKKKGLEKEENKDTHSTHKPLIYNNKPLISEEVPKEEKKENEVLGQSKKVLYQLDDSGNVIKKWPNTKTASTALNISQTQIYRAISQGYKSNNYFWSRTPNLPTKHKALQEKKKLKTEGKPKIESTDASLLSLMKLTGLMKKLTEVVSELRSNGINITVNISL